MTVIISPFSRNAGYYLSDNTASGGRKVEEDIQTCKHCQRVLYKAAWMKNGGFCKGCNSSVCASCATVMMKEGCKPYNAKIEESLESVVLLRQFRKAAGLDDPTRVFTVNTDPHSRG